MRSLVRRFLAPATLAAGLLLGAAPGLSGCAVPVNAIEAQALGNATYLGTIDFTSISKTNLTATTPFGTAGLNDKTLLLQATQDVYVLTGATPTAASTTSIKLLADERVTTHAGAHISLAAIRVSADGNLLVWNLQ